MLGRPASFAFLGGRQEAGAGLDVLDQDLQIIRTGTELKAGGPRQERALQTRPVVTRRIEPIADQLDRRLRDVDDQVFRDPCSAVDLELVPLVDLAVAAR